MIYGFGLNLSYFGIILIYIGVKKPVLSNWFRNILWFFVILDVYANISVIRTKIENRFFVTFDKKLKEGAVSKKSSKKKSDNEDEEDNE
jgi:phosphoglycerol transferase MdoB-like AlkP superfamily enzyme